MGVYPVKSGGLRNRDRRFPIGAESRQHTGVNFDPVKEILHSQILIGRMLVVVVIPLGMVWRLRHVGAR
jgi:hypothetical protein